MGSAASEGCCLGGAWAAGPAWKAGAHVRGWQRKNRAARCGRFVGMQSSTAGPARGSNSRRLGRLLPAGRLRSVRAAGHGREAACPHAQRRRAAAGCAGPRRRGGLCLHRSLRRPLHHCRPGHGWQRNPAVGATPPPRLRACPAHCIALLALPCAPPALSVWRCCLWSSAVLGGPCSWLGPGAPHRPHRLVTCCRLPS